MAHLSIWIHIVWATKSRSPMLTKSIRPIIFNHIRKNAKSKHIYIDHINGHKGHVHCVISLGPDQTIGQIAQLLKRESSYWANNKSTGLFIEKLKWADDYYAVSIGIKSVDNVRSYLRNQEEHHRNVSFLEECDQFIKRYGFTHYLK